jgi:DNA polymerase-3 subunit gamma/tau
MAGGGGVVAQARMAPQPEAVAEAAPTLQTFADMMALIEKKRDIVLRLDVEKYLRPIQFRPGAIEYEPAPGAPNNLAQRLVARLKEWTGQPWLIAARGGGGGETRWEQDQREKQEVKAEVEADPFVLAVKDAFPGAEVISIRNLPQPDAALVADAPEDDEDDE